MGMREYSELRQLLAGGSIQGKAVEGCAALVQSLAPGTSEPSRELDRALLLAAIDQPDPRPLLGLRCRISHALEAWLLVTYKAHHNSRGINLAAMASYALDDDGALTIRTAPQSKQPFTYAQLALMPKGLVSPFSAEVLRSYDSALCGLPHWARLKIQSHNELKAYFRQHGLLLISDWALLRNSSPTRVRQACKQHLRSGDTIETLCALHTRYGPLYDAAKLVYKQATGKASGWQPDLPFLRELAPDEDPFATNERLKAIASAIRQLMTEQATKSLDEAAQAGYEPADPASLSTASSQDEGPSSAELTALINAALQRAMDAHMPDVISAEGRQRDLLRCLWAGWAEGMSNRPLAERCGTSCGTVSKKLRPTEHASTIATAAALELKRHPAFSSCGQNVEAAERLVDALRNHLLEPEREGEVAPLRRWIQQYLSNP
jgi:DNA-binding NarL/FixJ family response regulator